MQQLTAPSIDQHSRLIDVNFQGEAGVIGAYLVGERQFAIVDCGPTTSLDSLVSGIEATGASMDAVSRIVLTHIHLDHAGGAGVLMRRYPHLRLSVHADAVPFLLDTERLIRSATRIFGDKMDRLWGEIAPCDPARIDPVQPGDVVQAGDVELESYAVPGHAGTHLAYFDRQTGTLYTGDAAGARLHGTAYVAPTLAPPELDFPLWARSVDTLKGLDANRLALTHFGAFDDVDRHLADVMPNIYAEEEVGRRKMTSAEDEDKLTEAIIAFQHDIYADESDQADALIEKMKLAMPQYMASQGLKRVFTLEGRIPKA